MAILFSFLLLFCLLGAIGMGTKAKGREAGSLMGGSAVVQR